MNRLDAAFAKPGKKLVIYATSRDGDSAAVFRAAAAGGADVIEVGVPFSDPTADGPAIQAASVRALAAGGGVGSALEDARTVRAAHSELGIILFGYLNPFLQHGDAASAAAGAAVDGILCVDLPPEEDDELGPALRSHGLHSIRLIAPTSTDVRIAAAAKSGGGFLYVVSVTGVTGGKMGKAADLSHLVARVRKKTKLPIVIGFGISTPDDAVRLAEHADGVVVGSAVVRLAAERGASEVERFVSSIRRALR